MEEGCYLQFRLTSKGICHFTLAISIMLLNVTKYQIQYVTKYYKFWSVN